MGQLEDRREEQKERHLQNKMLMKLAGLGVAAFINGGNCEPSDPIVHNDIDAVTTDGNDNKDCHEDCQQHSHQMQLKVIATKVQ